MPDSVSFTARMTSVMAMSTWPAVMAADSAGAESKVTISACTPWSANSPSASATHKGRLSSVGIVPMRTVVAVSSP